MGAWCKDVGLISVDEVAVSGFCLDMGTDGVCGDTSDASTALDTTGSSTEAVGRFRFNLSITGPTATGPGSLGAVFEAINSSTGSGCFDDGKCKKPYGEP